MIEVLLATAIFALLITAVAGVYLYGQESTALAGERARATLLAAEGIEAARNIRDASFAALTTGTHGLSVSGNKWVLSGSSDTTDIFTRSLSVSTIDADRKEVSCTVTWEQNAQRNGSITLTTELTNWRKQTGGGSATSTCNALAVSQGYSAGTCRQNTKQCSNNGEDHLVAGDVLCLTGPSADTCCALP